MEYRVKLGKYDDAQNYEDDLLIFGYSCKLFRDDEKALSLEREEHLIPWMGDSNLMIDRFDVRGALYDLSEAESKGKATEEMTAAELKEEEICEQERYLALFHDEFQQQVAQEEETKRLQAELASDGSNYNQVAFNYSGGNTNDFPPSSEYDDPQKQLVSEPVADSSSVDEDIFSPPQEMNIPYGMEVPKTVKQNKIIIKTAKFVVTQGAQMEIIIKTKQAGNPMFNFLAFDNSLNAYYKHVVFLIRNGRYRWDYENDSQTKAEANDQYLHPNLSHSVRPDLTPGVASPSRPSPHCAYSNLISKIREKQKVSVIEDPEIHSPSAPASPLPTSTPVQESQGISKPTSRVGLVDYPSFNQTADGNSDEELDPIFCKKFSKDIVHDYSNIKWPPPEMQMVIDKMASYIIKNGNGFEEVVRSRSDPRFEFLNKTHEYYPYYKCKIQLYSEVYGDMFKNSNKSQEWKKKNVGNGPKKNCDYSRNGGSRTISFSIKSREQEVSLTSHTTFPIESSTSEEDEDMEEEERERRRVERDQRRQARKLREEKEKKEREEYLRKERLRKEKEEEERRKEKRCENDDSGNEDLYDIFKYAQEMELDTSKRVRNDSSEDSNIKQEERKKKAVAFLSKLKDSKEDKKPIIYGPQIPPEIASGFMRSVEDSPSSSIASSESDKPPAPPLPTEVQKQPPPLPNSPSPPGLTEMLLSSYSVSKGKKVPEPTTISSSLISKCPSGDSTPINPMTRVLLNELSEASSKPVNDCVSEDELQARKSRSRKKHSRQRQKLDCPSPSVRKDRKKRKRSHGSSHKKKKRRSRSRSRSRGRSKSHRSYKKKQSKRSSHREKEKSRRKKHKRHKSPSSVSSLPSSESSSPSTPSTLPSESDSDMDIQVIESDDGKSSSRGSSIVSLPSISSVSKNSDCKKISSLEAGGEPEQDEKSSTKRDGSGSGEENPANRQSRSIYYNLENSNSSESLIETDKKTHFNPNTSSAMAKIAQGLRAKLNALLEKDSKLE